MIYKNIELKCNEQELQQFIDSINIEYEFRDFSQPFNNIDIKNETGIEKAQYYVLKINDLVIIQPFSPYKGKFVPVSEEDVKKQKEEIIDNMIFSKFKVTEEDKTNIEKETFTKTLAQLTVESKKKDAMIAQLAQQVNSLNIKISQMGGNQ